MTSTGRAAFELSRYRPDQSIIVFSHAPSILRRLCLGWGLHPAGVIPPEQDMANMVRLLINGSMESGLVQEEGVVTIVHGFLPGVSGTTNTVQVLDIREYLSNSTRQRAAAVAK